MRVYIFKELILTEKMKTAEFIPLKCTDSSNENQTYIRSQINKLQSNFNGSNTFWNHKKMFETRVVHANEY